MSRSLVPRPLVILFVILLALAGLLAFLAGRTTEKPPVTVEKPVALENLAN
ncbi:hypothetical protein [Sphingomonas sp. Y38-1Y]|uniref:hypothetical protein n=1 Tax=Sphingomonas sp. Y38-1Y TaxID=3078265 RepID=UPI0028EB17AB|nr:hypothetical protein [Sphingomonas sp. Y38-1Y]